MLRSRTHARGEASTWLCRLSLRHMKGLGTAYWPACTCLAHVSAQANPIQGSPHVALTRSLRPRPQVGQYIALFVVNKRFWRRL